MLACDILQPAVEAGTTEEEDYVEHWKKSNDLAQWDYSRFCSRYMEKYLMKKEWSFFWSTRRFLCSWPTKGERWREQQFIKLNINGLFTTRFKLLINISSWWVILYVNKSRSAEQILPLGYQKEYLPTVGQCSLYSKLEKTFRPLMLSRVTEWGIV